MPLDILCLPAFDDNYIWLLHCPETNRTAAVDPGDPAVVVAACEARGWTLDQILLTHHHWDHVDGVAPLRERYGCTVTGAAADSHRLPAPDRLVQDGDTVTVGTARARVMAVPGHTTGHIAYWFEGESALFCGDTLFSLGCGRMFEGTAAQFWSSLTALRALPDETRVFCTHEYTLSNWQFAHAISPQDEALSALGDRIRARREQGQPTLPVRLDDEKRLNPFLRADDPAIAAAVGLSGQDGTAVFAALRQQKNTFKG
ncbi:hydroxyacylglutathione hydrolase [Novispirillum itersonii]|uniref:Hydroxyacylglutathione hydrolase n=1 Tax=Novispirillum itersonii TaxID=189 RepID=A0A7W9ZFE3_NOVIT|nr:hydroxyacylglutathione hydrolase [Novispirillum itersonii]MBB6209019.1 hydroxyacylglutathione hydrolase [Novispirillum itersonii]